MKKKRQRKNHEEVGKTTKRQRNSLKHIIQMPSYIVTHILHTYPSTAIALMPMNVSFIGVSGRSHLYKCIEL